jgi:hypothetical protein
MARQLARRKQRERTVGVFVVLLGVAVLVVALLALREPNGHVASAQSQQRSGASNVAKQSSSHPSAASRPKNSTARRSDSHSGTAVRGIPLVVLNNTTVQGLAEQAAARFEAGGWKVTSYGNYQNDILSTCAYFDPATPGARAAARALRAQFPTIKRVEPKFPQLPAGPVVVVLTPDYSAG